MIVLAADAAARARAALARAGVVPFAGAVTTG